MPTPIPDTLRLGAPGLAGAEPQDAMAAFARRGLLQPSFRWQDVWQEEHGRAFAVAGVMRLDILGAFRDELELSIKEGRSLADFAQRIRPRLVREGFWGDVEVTDPDSGEIRTTRFNNRRLQLIYDVNLRQSHAAGRWARTERSKATQPFVMYRTRGDEKVRASHRPWDWLVLPVEHPFWDTHYPPNGWRCRCTAFAISESGVQQLIAAGKPVKRVAPPVQYVDFVNASTGEVQRVPRGVDPGFAYNPGRGHAARAGEVLTGRLQAAPEDVARAAIRAEVMSRRFAEFVTHPAAGQVVPVALLGDGQAQAIEAQVRVVHLSAATAEKQLAKHPELVALDYLEAQRAIDEGEAIQDGARSTIYVLERDGWVVVIKATQTGRAVFLTSMRKLSSDQAAKDRELRRLRRKGAA